MSRLLNRAINALPVELHIPGYQFCGPGTRLRKRLERGDQGINPLDAACREHDIAYSQSNERADRHAADRVLADRARERIAAKDSTLGEKAAATAVWAAVKAKTKLGMGMTKRRTKRKRVLPVAKRGGMLPLLPLLGVIGSLAGGAAGVAKGMNDAKTAQRQIEEMKRYNHAMECIGLYLAPHKSKGLYLAPYKQGKGLKKKKNVEKTIDMPAGVTTNLQLSQLARSMRIPYFRGVYMRNALPRKIRRNESGVVNLDDVDGPGTHWVAYAKRGDRAAYFDSFGNLRPPKEIARYLGNDITYNHMAYQTYDQTICGQLCLLFLRQIDLNIESSSINVQSESCRSRSR